MMVSLDHWRSGIVGPFLLRFSDLGSDRHDLNGLAEKPPEKVLLIFHFRVLFSEFDDNGLVPE